MGGGGGGDIKETEGEKNLAAITAEMWNMLRTEVEPIKKQFFDDMKVTESDYQKGQNFANVDAQAAIGGSNIVKPGMQRTGNIATQFNNFSQEAAQVEGGSKIRANMITEDMKNEALQSIVAAGLGQQSSANQGFMQQANNNFNQSVSDANNRFNSWSNKQNNLGALAGMGSYQFTKGKTDNE